MMGAGMVDEHPPHHLRGHGEELGAVLEGLVLRGEAAVGLVDERRRLQGVAPRSRRR